MSAAAASGAASLPLPLLELPDDLLFLIPRSLLARGRWRDALRLLEACTALRARLAPVRQEAVAEAAKRRLRWVEVKAAGEAAMYEVNNEGRTLRKLQFGFDRWAVGDKPLPTVGTSSWRVRVVQSYGGAAMLTDGGRIEMVDARAPAPAAATLSLLDELFLLHVAAGRAACELRVGAARGGACADALRARGFVEAPAEAPADRAGAPLSLIHI